jgi:PAS domain S-box-containing protein
MPDDTIVRLGSARTMQTSALQTIDALSKDDFFRGLLDSLPAAIYTTDTAGKITYYNEAAATLWGHRPQLNSSEWCGSWKLFWPDGQSMTHDQCPMATAVKERRPIRGLEAIAERPDGTRVPFIPFPTPIFDSAGQFVGAVNLLVDISDRKQAEEAMGRLAAIVESSDDAIIGKTLDGIITSWNKGAERVFGYLAQEIIGKSVKILIPIEYQKEEETILDRLRRGQHIEHYETVRQRKHGSRINVSLTISPIRSASGQIMGASKVARDITDRKRTEAQLVLLGREAEHRTKNILATVQAAVHLTRADTVEEFKEIVEGRIQALSNAHRLFAQSRWNGAELSALIANELSAFYQDNEPRIKFDGPDLILEPDAAQAVAISVHELATNAAKYGALSVPDGRIRVEWFQSKGQLSIRWTESGGPPVTPPSRSGFGMTVIENVLQGKLGGQANFEWRETGLCCTLILRSDFHPLGSQV